LPLIDYELRASLAAATLRPPRRLLLAISRFHIICSSATLYLMALISLTRRYFRREDA